MAAIGPQALSIPPCPFLTATGFHCPGCGSLRCLHYLWQREFALAWLSNPLAVCLLPVIGLLALMEFIRPAERIRPGIIYLMLAAIVLFGTIRNLPFMSHLRPVSAAQK